mmetsp:Transcript_64357/g.77325  ORF Transcript_64357/g.77325 Transcript_64357/m.77325 type:complete len:86 (-) Transcript_64357:33-290(-)
MGNHFNHSNNQNDALCVNDRTAYINDTSDVNDQWEGDERQHSGSFLKVLSMIGNDIPDINTDDRKLVSYRVSNQDGNGDGREELK